MKTRIVLKAEEIPVKKPEKSSCRSLFSLNFSLADQLHDVMHGKDGVNGEVNRAAVFSDRQLNI